MADPSWNNSLLRLGSSSWDTIARVMLGAAALLFGAAALILATSFAAFSDGWLKSIGPGVGAASRKEDYQLVQLGADKFLLERSSGRLWRPASGSMQWEEVEVDREKERRETEEYIQSVVDAMNRAHREPTKGDSAK